MNCYRCGFDFTGAQCLICGKLAPTEANPAGEDAPELRIAVIVPQQAFESEVLSACREQADHYQFCPEGGEPKHIFVYNPVQAPALFRLLQETEQVSGRQILFNGRQRPYCSDLWLPLLWYFSH